MPNPSEHVSDRTPRHRGPVECKPLITVANKDLFRKNAFRITALPVDATPREVSRHVDELKMRAELGNAPHKHKVAYPLNPQPTIDVIREAIQNIKDPEKRLIDEFFWFWPEEFGDSKSDLSCQALAQGDTAKANDIWRERVKEQTNGIVPKHNLAVSYLMTAIQMEYKALGHKIPEEKRQEMTEIWKSAVRKWNRIADDDNLWEKVADRIRQLNEANLKTGFARQMRASFPEAFLGINVELIMDLASSGEVGLAKQYLQYLRELCQRPNDLENSVVRILLPAKNRLKDHIRQALDQAEKKPSDGINVTRELLNQSRPTLDIFNLFFSAQSDVRNELFDDLVSTCNRLQVIYYKQTKDDVGCLEILKAILPLVSSSELKGVIEKDISETNARLERKNLESVYDLLKLIQDGLESPAKRLSWFKRDAVNAIAKASGVSGFSESFGFLATSSEPVKELLDSAAIVLRGISLDAWNKHDDRNTAIEANRLAILYAASPEVKKRLAEDKSTLDKQTIHNLDGAPFGQRTHSGRTKTGEKSSSVHPGLVFLGIIGILVIWGVIGSCNSTTNSPSATSYTPPEPSAPTYTPPPASDRGGSGNNVYRVPENVSSQLDQEKAGIESDRAIIKQLDAELDTLGREIENDRIYLDKTSQYAVDTFNAKVDRYNALSQQDKDATAAFNLRVDNYNARLRANAR